MEALAGDSFRRVGSLRLASDAAELDGLAARVRVAAPGRLRGRVADATAAAARAPLRRWFRASRRRRPRPRALGAAPRGTGGRSGGGARRAERRSPGELDGLDCDARRRRRRRRDGRAAARSSPRSSRRCAARCSPPSRSRSASSRAPTTHAAATTTGSSFPTDGSLLGGRRDTSLVREQTARGRDDGRSSRSSSTPSPPSCSATCRW